MFARIALRIALVPIVRSPFAGPARLLGCRAPAFHLGSAHSRQAARVAVQPRRPRSAASLLDTAVTSLPRVASRAVRDLEQRRSRPSSGDTSVVFG